MPSSFRSIHYGDWVWGGSWGPSTHTSLCVSKVPLPVTRQAGETWTGSARGWQSAKLRRGLVAFVACPSVSAASVVRSTSHVKVVTFSGWEPHGGHQAHGYPHSWFSPWWRSHPEAIHILNINVAFHACHTGTVQAVNAIEGLGLNLYANSDYLVRRFQDNLQQKTLKL